jgi:hypothetical protein
MCIKNADVDKMLKGIRQIENDDMAMMETHQLAEVMVIFKALSDDYEKIEKALKEELTSRMDHEIVLTFADYNRKVQLKEGRQTKKIDGGDLFLAMRDAEMENLFPEVVNVVFKKIDEVAEETPEIKAIADGLTQIEIGQPYIAVTKMAKSDY